MKKLILIVGMVSFPAIASASYLFGIYKMASNPILTMNLLGIGLFAVSQVLRQVMKTK